MAAASGTGAPVAIAFVKWPRHLREQSLLRRRRAPYAGRGELRLGRDHELARPGICGNIAAPARNSLLARLRRARRAEVGARIALVAA